MLALQLLALGFLALSAAFLFGPPLLIYGPKTARDMVRDGQMQFVGGCFASLIILVLTAPHIGTAFLTGGGAITLVMVDLFTMQFSPV
jgi:hypothetical protein